MRPQQVTYLRISDFAKRLGVTPSCVRKWLFRGHMNYIRVGPQPQRDIMGRDRRTIRIPSAELDRFREIVDAKIV